MLGELGRSGSNIAVARSRCRRLQIRRRDGYGEIALGGARVMPCRRVTVHSRRECSLCNKSVSGFNVQDRQQIAVSSEGGDI